MDIPVRTYEVFGFDAFKFKVKADYDWGEARLEAIEELTGSQVSEREGGREGRCGAGDKEGR
jgi:hypothetical protein